MPWPSAHSNLTSSHATEPSSQRSSTRTLLGVLRRSGVFTFLYAFEIRDINFTDRGLEIVSLCGVLLSLYRRAVTG